MTPLSLLRQIEGNILSLESSTLLTVIETLDHFFKDVKIDKALAKRIYHFQIGYVNTSREYVEFFGSNLLGVHVIRFKESDVMRFFNEVLEIDYYSLESKIRECDTIEHDNLKGKTRVSADVFNLTVVYLLHRCLNETSLNDKDRTWISYNTALIFFYRSIAALSSAWFTYPADPKIAQAAYANLSFKYLIKRLGSWHRVMEYRANEFINKSGIHYARIYKLESDDELVKLINSAANSMKDIVKNYYSEFDKVITQGDKITVTQSVGKDIEGKDVLRDRVRNIDKSIDLIKKLILDPNTLIRDDYVRVICDINRNTSPRLLKETLTWISSHASSKDFKLINETVSSIVIYSFYLIETRIEPHKVKDIGYVLLQLKNLYLSSRSTDMDLIKIRDHVDQILIKAHHKLSTPLILSTRTATVLYIAFIALIGDHRH